MSNVYSAKSIANYFLSKDSVSPMKLQKLVYFAHGWFIGLNQRPLIDECIEAWEYGPVVPSLYSAFKNFGNGNITQKAKNLEMSGASISFNEVLPPDDSDVTQFLDCIWEIYSGFSPIQLSNMTHEPGTPWDQVVKKSKESNSGILVRNLDIPNELIAEYFKKLAQNHVTG